MSAPKITRAELSLLDIEGLMKDDRFKRFLFTQFEVAGIFGGSFHSEDAVLSWREGRRSLGLDTLRTVAGATRSTVEQTLRDILETEINTQTEVQDGRRDQYQRARDAELGGDDPDDERAARRAEPEPDILKYD